MSGVRRMSAGMPFWKNRSPGPNRMIVVSRNWMYQLLYAGEQKGAHLQHDHRHCQKSSKRDGAEQALCLPFACISLSVDRFTRRDAAGCIAGLFDRSLKIGKFGRTGNDADGRPRGCEIHRRVRHTGHGFQRRLDPIDARGATHALDREIDGLGCNVIAGIPDGADDSLCVSRAGKCDIPRSVARLTAAD